MLSWFIKINEIYFDHFHGASSSSPLIDAARQMNAATKRAARAAQSVEQQQAAREHDASARHAARAAQFAEQQQAARE
jgi:hypothetical protein